MKYLSKHRFIIEGNRSYSLKTINGSGRVNYGIILKMDTVDCRSNYKQIGGHEERDNKDLEVIDYVLNIFFFSITNEWNLYW